MGAPEAYVEKYLVNECKKHNILCWKLKCPGNDGVPDRLVLHAGRTVFIETKRLGGKARKLQEVRIQQIRDSGNWAEIANTRQAIDDILAKLEQLADTKGNDYD